MQYDEKTIKTLLKNSRYKGEYCLNILSVVLTLAVNILLIYASYNLGTNPAIAETIANYTAISYELIEYLSIFNSYAIVILLLIICLLICFYNTSYRIKAGLKNLSIDAMPDKESYFLYEKYCKL